MSLYAQTFGFAPYADSAHKLLSCNRDLYLRQSAMTSNGRVPTADEVRNSFQPHRQDEAAASRGALEDGDFLYGGGGVECGHAKAGKNGSIEFGGQRLATVVKGSESSLYRPKSQMPEVRSLPRATELDSPVNRSECRSSALPASTQSPLKDEQPRRAASPIPGTYDPDPPTPEEVAEAFQFKYGV